MSLRTGMARLILGVGLQALRDIKHEPVCRIRTGKFCLMAMLNKSLEVGAQVEEASHLLAVLRSSAVPTLEPLRAALRSPRQAKEVMLRTAVKT